MSSIQYQYDLLGKTLAASNGQGTSFNYIYDSAGRLTSMTSSLSDPSHPGMLLSGMTYNALGQVTASSVGSALNEALHYDCRGRLLSYNSAVSPAVPSGTVPNTPGCPQSTAMNVPGMGTGVPAGKDTPWYWQNPAVGWAGAMRPVASIVIMRSSKKKNRKDHGVLKVEVKSLHEAPREQTVAVKYGKRDTARDVAERVAEQFGLKGSLVQARVKTLGETATVQLMSADNGGPGNFVSASVKSNHRHASLTATVSLAYGRATPAVSARFMEVRK
jgi:YD repeat-containing protein